MEFRHEWVPEHVGPFLVFNQLYDLARFNPNKMFVASHGNICRRQKIDDVRGNFINRLRKFSGRRHLCFDIIISGMIRGMQQRQCRFPFWIFSARLLRKGHLIASNELPDIMDREHGKRITQVYRRVVEVWVKGCGNHRQRTNMLHQRLADEPILGVILIVGNMVDRLLQIVRLRRCAQLFRIFFKEESKLLKKVFGANCVALHSAIITVDEQAKGALTTQQNELWRQNKKTPYMERLLICNSKMVRLVDYRWNQIEESLLLMYKKLRDLELEADELLNNNL